MKLDPSLLYAKTHEWVRFDAANNRAYIGITDFAQSQLGEIVFVDLPSTGNKVNAGDDLTVVESVKGASDIYAPISGVVSEVNTELEKCPGSINQDPYKAWIVELSTECNIDVSSLLSAEQYEAQCQSH